MVGSQSAGFGTQTDPRAATIVPPGAKRSRAFAALAELLCKLRTRPPTLTGSATWSCASQSRSGSEYGPSRIARPRRCEILRGALIFSRERRLLGQSHSRRGRGIMGAPCGERTETLSPAPGSIGRSNSGTAIATCRLPFSSPSTADRRASSSRCSHATQSPTASSAGR